VVITNWKRGRRELNLKRPIADAVISAFIANNPAMNIPGPIDPLQIPPRFAATRTITSWVGVTASSRHYTNHEYGLRSVRSANSIEAVPQRKLKNDYGAAEDGNGGSVSWRIEQTKAYPNPAIRL
jgi:hypothetical protein